MIELKFNDLDRLFRDDNFPAIENDRRGMRYLKLRSMSRRDLMEEFCTLYNIDISDVSPRNYISYVFDKNDVSESSVESYINNKYNEERLRRSDNQDYLIDQLGRLRYFDWGGSFGNSLEKNIVNNYVKKIQSYDLINTEIEGSLLLSLRGYTLNSWYNHWTSILIEDLFKDHKAVLPTVGLVKKIDFFINNTPFDLKVTYFPEQLLADKLRSNGYGNELTMLKRICRNLNIFIPTDMKDKELKLHLYSKVSENQSMEAREFIADLKENKRQIIAKAESNPEELKKWFYENQGEARFDASNRFFLVLTDESDMTNSWKLKRNISFLKEKINDHLDKLSDTKYSLDTEFFWVGTQRNYRCKSDILFLKYNE